MSLMCWLLSGPASHLVLRPSPPVGMQELLSLVHAAAQVTLKGWETQSSEGAPERGFYQQTKEGKNTVGVSAKRHMDFSKPAGYHLHLRHQKLEGGTEGCHGGKEVNDGSSFEHRCGENMWLGRPASPRSCLKMMASLAWVGVCSRG